MMEPFRFDWAMANKYMVAAKRFVAREAWYGKSTKLRKQFSVTWDGEKYVRRNGNEWKPTREDMAAQDWSVAP